ncbi:MAG: NADH-quinone oxidoreductase subunit NuoH [Rickettsiaceae bacterium H1]|nr:NADH-quinone oxidoreductase subunit NuoH [Rickettsiaceae bacterium H1]
MAHRSSLVIEYLISKVLQIIMLVIPLILAIAYLTYAERKILSAIQLRLGPTKVGVFGLLQPIADAIKMLVKENIFPTKANKVVFILAPVTTFVLAFIGWAVIPWDAKIIDGVIIPKVIADINVGVLYLLAISSLGVYGIIMAGWASNSHYAFLGALRSASQMISYEVSMGLVIVCVVILTGSLNLAEIVVAKHNLPYWVDIFMFPMALVFFISILAETNRHPFDLPEAEAELVAGYNVEYSSISFTLFFLGEYANMILTSAMMVLFFLGGWYPPIDVALFYKVSGLIWFCLKISFILFWFIVVRGALPRYRYDQLMRLGWKILLPISLFWVVLTAAISIII